ncbi:MAG: potassium-transporting ATPase subunit KdpC [Candidatus Obscuribacterales bacterium]
MNISELLRQCCLLFVVLSIITGIVYPLAITGIAQVLWPAKANGSLVRVNGNVVGSALLGQEFTSSRYFWGRPSATSPAYNAAASSGSNLGPLNPALSKNAKDRLAALSAADAGMETQLPPVDLVTSSGSGLDPHISIAAARYQAARVARERHLTAEEVNKLIEAATEPMQLGVLGEPRVNVLLLNLSLDKSAK